MKKKRLLLLEPDHILGEMYRTGFREAGFTVDWSKTASGAVLLADKKIPDVVVVELQIARHNGVEFLYEFKSYAEWMDVPVVIHTLLSPEEVVAVSSLPAGLKIVGVLHKSHTLLQDLVTAVDAAVGQSHAA